MQIVKKAIKISKIFQTWTNKKRVKIEFQIFSGRLLYWVQ